MNALPIVFKPALVALALATATAFAQQPAPAAPEPQPIDGTQISPA